MSTNNKQHIDAAEDGPQKPAEVTPVPLDLGSNDGPMSQSTQKPEEVTPVPLSAPPRDLESNDDPMSPPPVASKPQPVSNKANSRFTKKQLGIAAALATICVIIVLVLSFTLGASENKQEQGPPAKIDFFEFCLDKPSTNNPNPTDANSSAACDVLDNDELMDISDSLFGARVCPCQSEENCCTAEEKALAWMIRDTFNSTLVANASVSIDNRNSRMRERFALVHLYYQTRLDDPEKYTYLSEADHCNFPLNDSDGFVDDDTFAFVRKCDSENRVLDIFLKNIRRANPGATIPTTIEEFSRIQNLHLSFNLAGSIPSNIGLLSKLETLVLTSQWEERVNLIGAVPTEIGNLVSLKVLHLEKNQLTAKLPTEIGKLASLEELYLSGNQFAPDLFPAEVNQLSNLKKVDLSRNPLSIVPPEIKNMAGLESLRMADCSLQGSVSGIDYPSGLMGLHLENNQLSGTIETDIGLLTKLEEGLTLSNNTLEGPLPLELFELTNLTNLVLNDNPLNASIPTEIGKLTKLNNFYAESCSLTGVIPTEISLLTAINEAVFYAGYLSLHDNALTGSIPPLHGRFVSLQNNKLNGQISPELFESLSKTWEFDASNNELDGQLPSEIGLLTNIKVLELDGNNLDGSIPTEIGNLSDMAHLYLNDCSLTGSVPTELGLLSANLRSLTVQNNQLTGKIPTELNALLKMRILNISGNLFSDMALTDVCKSTVRSDVLPTFIAECDICDNAPAEGCCKSCV